MSYYYGETSYSDYSEPTYHNYTEDTSHYCYSVPSHYDDTTEDYDHSVYPSESLTYIDTTHLDPSYTSDVSMYEDNTIPDEFHDDVPMYEDEIHPAYCYDPVDSLDEISTPPIQPPTTCFTVDNPPNDLTILMESPTDYWSTSALDVVMCAARLKAGSRPKPSL